MKKYQYLYAVEKHVDYIFDRKKIVKELEDHIDDNIEELIHEGYTQEEAEVRAVEMMGNPHEVGKELNKLHNPIIGYLLILSRIAVLAILFSLSKPIFTDIEGTVKMFSPIVSENSVETIEINEEIYLSSYKILIDNLCVSDTGTNSLTYRCFRRYNHTRTVSSVPVFILDLDDTVETNGYDICTPLGIFGEVKFDKQQDKLTLRLYNREEFILDLKEYRHE